MAVSVSTLVPCDNGKSSTQNRPLRSTSPLYEFVTPFVSTVVTITPAVGLSSQPATVKLVPQTVAPSNGKLSVMTGAFVPGTTVIL